MFKLFFAGGAYMWLLLFLAAVILTLAIKKFIDLYVRRELSSAQLENGINAIMFWGSFSVILGIFAHFSGVFMAMQAISRANDISPAIVAHGYGLSLITMLSGLLIFMIASIIWFVLRWQYKRTIRE